MCSTPLREALFISGAKNAAQKHFPGVEKKMQEMYTRRGGLYDKEQSEEEYVKIIETLIDRGADLDARDAKEGCPAIVLAARHGKAKIIEALLGHGADVNAACTEGLAENTTALVVASVHGDPDTLHTLLAAPSCDCRPAQAGFTAVILAAHLGRNEALEILAESKKCDLDAAMGEEAGNAEGKTAAHHCAENNQWECIDILGRHGANLDVTDKWGQTPHHAALYFKYDKVLEALERHGAQWSPPPELPREL